MLSNIKSVIEGLDYSTISTERKELLEQTAQFIQTKVDQNERVNLVCVCTHNSRRSHLCQVWSKVASMHFRVRKVNSYSGGTEVTAVNQQIIKTLDAQGFTLITLSDSDNPIYALKYDEAAPPIHLFSKKYENPYNPNSNFIAFMNCDHADQNCPVVLGAENRFKINYLDPKRSDGTADQERIYLETSQLIATEMFYLFSKIKK